MKNTETMTNTPWTIETMLDGASRSVEAREIGLILGGKQHSSDAVALRERRRRVLAVMLVRLSRALD